VKKEEEAGDSPEPEDKPEISTHLVAMYAVADSIIAEELASECIKELTLMLNHSNVRVMRQQADQTTGCHTIVELCDTWAQDNKMIPSRAELADLLCVAFAGSEVAQTSCSMLLKHMAGIGQGHVVLDVLREHLKNHTWFGLSNVGGKYKCALKCCTSFWLIDEAFTHMDEMEVLMHYCTNLQEKLEVHISNGIEYSPTVKEYLEEESYLVQVSCYTIPSEELTFPFCRIMALLIDHLLSVIKADLSSAAPDIFMDILPLLLSPMRASGTGFDVASSVYCCVKSTERRNDLCDFLDHLPRAYLPSICLKLGQTKAASPTKNKMLSRLKELMSTHADGKCTW
jgi:hypothetical protein